MADNNSKTTQNHEEIKKWAEERKAIPSIIKGTGENGGGILRFDLPGYSEDSLEEISWEKFFQVFDDRNLTFLYEEKTENGINSNFNKFIRSEG